MYKKIIKYIKEKYGRSVKTCWIADMKERCGLPVKKAPKQNRPEYSHKSMP